MQILSTAARPVPQQCLPILVAYIALKGSLAFTALAGGSGWPTDNAGTGRGHPSRSMCVHVPCQCSRHIHSYSHRQWQGCLQQSCKGCSVHCRGLPRPMCSERVPSRFISGTATALPSALFVITHCLYWTSCGCFGMQIHSHSLVACDTFVIPCDARHHAFCPLKMLAHSEKPCIRSASM